MEIELKEDERIDDLEWNGLKVIQNINGFCFGMDSVLLSDFAKDIKKHSKVADLGTGTGIISILLSHKIEPKEIVGIELQEDVANMAKRSIILNGLQDIITIKNIDIKEADKHFENGYFDAIVTNPPYKKINTGIINENNSKFISRHEVKCSLNDVLEQSFFLLKDKGELYMVHRPDRLVDIIDVFRKNKIEPKKIRFVYPNIDKKPNLVLIQGIKKANPSVIVEKPLIVYDKEGNYTDEILEIYHKK